MHYTIYPDNKIDQKINEDMEYIVQQVRSLLGNKVHSIVLSGGFGRGEGSVVFKDRQIRVINDYDIDVIVYKNSDCVKYRHSLNELAEELAATLGIKQIDFGIRVLSSLRSLPLTICTYELLKGYKVLFGDIDLSEIMPKYDPVQLSLFEGTRLLFNRGGGLLIAAKYFKHSGVIREENIENFIIECDKAIMAMGDSVLLLKKRYHYLYSIRKKIIQELNLQDIPLAEKIVPMYISSLENKIRPCFDRYSSEDLISWWFEIQAIYGDFYKHFEHKRLKCQFEDWLDYVRVAKWEDKIGLQDIMRKFSRMIFETKIGIVTTKTVCDKLITLSRPRLLSVLPLLLFGVTREGYNESYVRKAGGLLHHPATEAVAAEWEVLSNIFLKAWHPAGVVAKISDNNLK